MRFYLMFSDLRCSVLMRVGLKNSRRRHSWDEHGPWRIHLDGMVPVDATRSEPEML